MTAITIVVPCYNEEEALPETSKRLLSLLDKLQQQSRITADSRISFIDDGSDDHTWELIEKLAGDNPQIHGIKLTRNMGHQNALLAGLLTVEGDVVISIDADLQDDINIIEEMIDAFHEGKDIVYGVRRDRNVDGLFKRYTAQAYYKLLKLLGINIVFNHADYRLMSRRALDALKEYKEVNLFLRGVIPTIGYPSKVLAYDRSRRFAGKSKYPLHKMLALAIDGITSFSAIPLRLIAGLGVLVFLVSLACSIWVLWVRFVSGDAVPGWASSVLPMYFLGGIQLLCVGIVGEYVSKIYMEIKQRPRFIIEKTI